MKSLGYKEGDFFAVPLESMGFAIGLVARMPKRGGGLFGYFWGPAHPSIPVVEDLLVLKPADAIFMAKFGDLRLIKNVWPVIGHLPGWDRSSWPMPKFIRGHPHPSTGLLITYSEDDPSVEIRSEPYVENVEGYPKEGLYGAGAVEAVLNRILK